MFKAISAKTVAALLIAWLPLLAPPLWAHRDRPETPPLFLIERLASPVRILHIGAHPDDEESGLLAYLARGLKARTGYLSLTRGDGGQNLIGGELYEALGLIRTEELLAARAIDGAEQLFARAYDFGFCKDPAEALARWGEERLLADTVRAVRSFRPHIIIARFAGTPDDGHCHHQVAGIIARRAFHAAADPNSFPDQGLRPWSAQKFYVVSNEREATIAINVGEFDPLFGRSYYQIGMAGRALHRSQGQGALELRGPVYAYLKLAESRAGPVAPESSIFDGIASALEAAAEDEVSRERLREIESLIASAAAAYHPRNRLASAELLLKALAKLRELMGNDRDPELRFLLERKAAEFNEAISALLGISLEAVVPQPAVVPGEELKLEVKFLNRAATEVSLNRVEVIVPEGWSRAPLGTMSPAVLNYNEEARLGFAIRVAEAARPTMPHWLRRERSGDSFATEEMDLAILPHAPPEVMARAYYSAWGYEASIEAPAEFIAADPAEGEIRLSLAVVPKAAVRITPELLLLPLKTRGERARFKIEVESNWPGEMSGRLRLILPKGFSARPEAVELSFKRRGEKRGALFELLIPPQAAAGEYSVEALFEQGGERYASGYRLISYPHIRPNRVYRPARARLLLLDAKLPERLRLGYVMGSGDSVPEVLTQLGASVQLLDSDALAFSELDRFDAIIVGVRAYAVRDDLKALNARLLDYVRRGGLLVVQYQTYEFFEGNFAPYPLKANRPHDRVVDETAPVEMLEPEHPIFNRPNRIEARDFEGWVQERGLYFAAEWDRRYRALLASADKGEEAKRGGLLVASYGIGTYIYTGYAWFRQLPAGVPGGIRLFLNLVSLRRTMR